MESSSGHQPFANLQIALVLDSLTVPAWIAASVESLGAEFPIQSVTFLPYQQQAQPYLFRRFLALDQHRNHPGPDPLVPVDLSQVLAGVRTERFESLDPNLDVLLWFSQTDPSVSPPVPTRSGTWFFCHGSGGPTPAVSAYFAELAAHQAVSSSYLLALAAPGKAPFIVADAHTASEIGWSLTRHRRGPLWKAATLPLAGLRVLQGNPRAVSQDSARSAPNLPARSPTNASVVSFAARNLARTINRRLRYAGKESHWFVSYRTLREEFVANKGRFTAAGLQSLPSPAGHFYADPFVLTWRGRTFLFVEDYLYAERRGVLSVLELLPNGHFGEATQILNRPYHLSYPFVFECQGEVFLIPETMAARRIELYRAVDMPFRWEIIKVLQENVEAVDTTLWMENETFYFFTNLVRPGLGANDLLFLFTADSLTGDWTPHPANPISRDVRRARGAGKLFRLGGKLVRPAQDCSVRYGYATQLNEVTQLSPAHFCEKPLFRIEPDWAPNLIGTHTINSNEAVEVIDGQVYRTRYSPSDNNQPEES